MLRQVCKRVLAQQLLQQQGPGIAWGCVRQVSEQAKAAVEKALVVDTLKMSKEFEDVGLTRKAAEQLTTHITSEIILDRIRLSEKFVPKLELEKLLLEADAKVQGFKAELVQKQDMHLATLHKDLERQQNYLDKMKAEVRHEIDKLTASQRLDLNLEKGRMRDDLQQLRDKTIELEIKMDREINDLKAGVEKAKNDVIKSTIAIFASFSAIAFTMSRFIQMV